MATQYVRLQENLNQTVCIKAYLERVPLYFAANESADDKKVLKFNRSTSLYTAQ